MWLPSLGHQGTTGPAWVAWIACSKELATTTQGRGKAHVEISYQKLKELASHVEGSIHQ